MWEETSMYITALNIAVVVYLVLTHLTFRNDTDLNHACHVINTCHVICKWVLFDLNFRMHIFGCALTNLVYLSISFFFHWKRNIINQSKPRCYNDITSNHGNKKRFMLYALIRMFHFHSLSNSLKLCIINCINRGCWHM